MEAANVINSRLSENCELRVDLDSADSEGCKQSSELLLADPSSSNSKDAKDDTITFSRSSRSRSRSKSRDSVKDCELTSSVRSRSRSRSPLSNSENKGLETNPNLENQKPESLETDAVQNPSHIDLSSRGNLSFFSSGPVFPARHTRDLLLVQNAKSNLESNENKLYPKHETLQDQEKDQTGNGSGLPSFLNHDHVESEPILDDGSTENNPPVNISAASPGSHDTDFLTNSNNLSNQSNANGGAANDQVSAAKESSPAEKSDLESESLAPLNASFFNCQYQTPSWIDDPLIGVPASAMENKNTHRKTGADMRILTAYMRSLNEMRLPEAIPPSELDRYLSSFFLVVRKADGSEYEPCSLRAMLASIERYLRFKNYPLSLTRDSAFSNMRNILKLKQQTLRSIGKGQKNSNEVSPASLAREGKIAHLFKSQEMGPYTPTSVVFTLCFYFCMYLKLRKSTENKKLLWGDITLLKDESGREFLTFSSQMLRRNQGSSKVNLRQRSYRVWADPTSPEKDPVTIYKFYAQKRPASTNTNFSPFYLGVNVLYPTQGQPWYRPAAMGINKLNEMVRQIRDITGVRTTSDFQNTDVQGKNQPALEVVTCEQRNGHSPFKDVAERQDMENHTVIKTEVVEDGDDDEDSCSNLAIDFSHEIQSSPVDLPSTADAGSVFSLQQTLSEGDNSSDSFPRHPLHFPSSQMNGAVNHEARSAVPGQEEDLDLATNASSPPESPLNCSTKDRISQAETEDLQQAASPGSGFPEAVSVAQAKQQLLTIARKMEPSSLAEFGHWLRAVRFEADPFSGQIMCKEEERQRETPPLSVKATSSCSPSGANIVLSISLTQKALHGDGPITVTAEASPSASEHHEQKNSLDNFHNNSITAKPTLFQGKQEASPPSTAISRSLPTSSAQHQHGLPFEAPLDLAASPLSRSSKSSSAYLLPHLQQAKSSLWSAGADSPLPTNGQHPLLSALFPNSSTSNSSSSSTNTTTSGSSSTSAATSTTAGMDTSTLAKRLRLSAEQAEAYTSASILASLSSASLASERLRLHFMQAGLNAGGNTPNYGLDPHTAAGLLDLAASSEVMRSQLLQHYGMKAEPK